MLRRVCVLYRGSIWARESLPGHSGGAFRSRTVLGSPLARGDFPGTQGKSLRLRTQMLGSFVYGAEPHAGTGEPVGDVMAANEECAVLLWFREKIGRDREEKVLGQVYSGRTIAEDGGICRPDLIVIPGAL